MSNSKFFFKRNQWKCNTFKPITAVPTLKPFHLRKVIICATLLALVGTHHLTFGQSNENENHVVCKNSPDGYFVDNPMSCQAFWVCIGGIGYLGLCEPEYNFNEERQLCDSPDHFACPTTPFECPPSGIHFFGRHGSCTKYNFCFSGNLTVRECVNGLHYDVVRKTCDRPEIADCGGRKCPLLNDANNLVTHPAADSCEE